MSSERQKLKFVASEEEGQRKHEKNERRENETQKLLKSRGIHHFHGKSSWNGKLVMVQDFPGVTFRRARVSRGWMKTITNQNGGAVDLMLVISLIEADDSVVENEML